MNYLNNKLISTYLMSCYLYYQKNESVLSDKEFDKLCSDIVSNYDTIDHPHKPLVKIEYVEAQTGYNIIYPTIVKCSAIQWLEESKQVEEEDDFWE